MASRLSLELEVNQVFFEKKHWIRKVILNRPQKLNVFSYEMVLQTKKTLEEYEVDDKVKLVILKGQGKVFCAGADVVRIVKVVLAGHWSFIALSYRKKLLLDYMAATYKKPLVILIDGIVMGGGAGISMNGRFRIVTQNAVFAMPEASIGHYPDVGASYFLSRLPAYFGEYLGLTGAKLSGAEMLECGLATHFVVSEDLESLENELEKVAHMDESAIPSALEIFSQKPNSNQNSAYKRLDIIDKCFSKKTVEDILSALESEVERCGDKWMINAINSMKAASPTSLKICLKSIREGRNLTLEECLRRDYNIFRHLIRRSFNSDFFEGIRAVLVDKDKRPKWNPSKLEQVSEEYVNKFFQEVDNDEQWDSLGLPDRKITNIRYSRL